MHKTLLLPEPEMSQITIPKFRLPAFVADIGRKLPQWPHALALVAGLNAALKLNLLPEDGLTALEDKLFLVRVLDTGGAASYTYRDGLFRPVFSPDREPAERAEWLEVVIRAFPA